MRYFLVYQILTQGRTNTTHRKWNFNSCMEVLGPQIFSGEKHCDEIDNSDKWQHIRLLILIILYIHTSNIILHKFYILNCIKIILLSGI